MGVLPDGRDRADVWAGGLLPQIRRQEDRDKRPLARYRDESKRLLGVIDKRLEGRDWIMGDDYTIADISMLGWVRNLIGFTARASLSGLTASRTRPLGWSGPRAPGCGSRLEIRQRA